MGSGFKNQEGYPPLIEVGVLQLGWEIAID